FGTRLFSLPIAFERGDKKLTVSAVGFLHFPDCAVGASQRSFDCLLSDRPSCFLFDRTPYKFGLAYSLSRRCLAQENNITSWQTERRHENHRPLCIDFTLVHVAHFKYDARGCRGSKLCKSQTGF